MARGMEESVLATMGKHPGGRVVVICEENELTRLWPGSLLAHVTMSMHTLLLDVKLGSGIGYALVLPEGPHRILRLTAVGK